MKVITGTREFCIEEPTVVTIGKFDGRHKGHQKLLKEMLRQKECHGWKTAVFTFDMAPMGVVSGKAGNGHYRNEERRNNMTGYGYGLPGGVSLQPGSSSHVTGGLCHRGAGKADARQGRGGRTGLQLRT
ncbi:MAG: hypothetical protein ACLSE4_13785 [Clostridium sp.]